MTTPIELFPGPDWSGNLTRGFGNTLSLLFVPGAGNGTLIATTRANGADWDVPVLRRSTDGGVTYGPVVWPVGRPIKGARHQQVEQVFDPSSNKVILLLGTPGGSRSNHSKGASECESGALQQTHSTSAGLTWAPLRDLGHQQEWGENDRQCLSPPGGLGVRLSTGRILMVATHQPHLCRERHLQRKHQ